MNDANRTSDLPVVPLAGPAADPAPGPGGELLSGKLPAAAIVWLAFLATITVIVLARSFLMPVMLAVLLAVTLAPIRQRADRLGLPTGLTSLLLVGALFAGVAALVFLLSGPVRSYVDDAPAIIEDVERKLRGVFAAIESVSRAGEELSEVAGGEEGEGDETGAEDRPGAAARIDGADGGETEEEGDGEQEVVVASGPGLATRAATTAPGILGQAVLAIALLYFLLAAGDTFRRRLIDAVPLRADKRRIVEISDTVQNTLGRYFLTVALINSGLGLAIGLALFALGMPNPVLFGTMAAVLNFIPYLGAIVGVAITFAIGIVTYDTVGQAALAAGVYYALTTFEGNFVTPYAVGRNLNLNPVLVFLSVAFWGWAWSFIGMFLAVPILISVRVICEKVPSLSRIAPFFAGGEAGAVDEPDR